MNKIYVRIRQESGMAGKKVFMTFDSAEEASQALKINVATLYRNIDALTSVNHLILSSTPEHKSDIYSKPHRRRFAMYDAAGNIISNIHFDYTNGHDINSLTVALRTIGAKSFNGTHPSDLGIRKKLAGVTGVKYAFEGIYVKSVKPYIIPKTVKVQGYSKCTNHRYAFQPLNYGHDTNLPVNHFTVNSKGNLSSRCVSCKAASLSGKEGFVAKMQFIFNAKHGVDVPAELFTDAMYVKYYNALGCFESTPKYDTKTGKLYTHKVGVTHNGRYAVYSSIHHAKIMNSVNIYEESYIDQHNSFISDCTDIQYIPDYDVNVSDCMTLALDIRIVDWMTYWVNRH